MMGINLKAIEHHMDAYTTGLQLHAVFYKTAINLNETCYVLFKTLPLVFCKWTSTITNGKKELGGPYLCGVSTWLTCVQSEIKPCQWATEVFKKYI